MCKGPIVCAAVWIAVGTLLHGCAISRPSQVAIPAVQPPTMPTLPAITIAAPLPVAEPLASAAIELAASVDANPDSTGRPSPIVVRVYQLRADGAFSAADFFALYDEAEKAVGVDLVSRDEYVLTPGERRSVGMTFTKDARFMAVIAAFRDVRNAQWKTIVPVPRERLTVSVGRSSVVATLGSR